MRTTILTVLMAILVLTALHVAVAAPAAGDQAAPKIQGQSKWMDQLTADQKAQVAAKVKEMTAAGKSKQEIRTAVMEMLKGWGIKVQAQGAKGAGIGNLMAKLTDEQRKQLQSKITEMRAAGKTPEEIRAACAEMLKGWGIEMPQPRQGAGLKALMEKLTPDQRQQVQAKVKELRDAGKTPAEIKAAVLEMLKGWGVQPPAQ